MVITTSNVNTSNFLESVAPVLSNNVVGSALLTNQLMAKPLTALSSVVADRDVLNVFYGITPESRASALIRLDDARIAGMTGQGLSKAGQANATSVVHATGLADTTSGENPILDAGAFFNVIGTASTNAGAFSNALKGLTLSTLANGQTRSSFGAALDRLKALGADVVDAIAEVTGDVDAADGSTPFDLQDIESMIPLAGSSATEEESFARALAGAAVGVSVLADQNLIAAKYAAAGIPAVAHDDAIANARTTTNGGADSAASRLILKLKMDTFFRSVMMNGSDTVGSAAAASTVGALGPKIFSVLEGLSSDAFKVRMTLENGLGHNNKLAYLAGCNTLQLNKLAGAVSGQFNEHEYNAYGAPTIGGGLQLTGTALTTIGDKDFSDLTQDTGANKTFSKLGNHVSLYFWLLALKDRNSNDPVVYTSAMLRNYMSVFSQAMSGSKVSVRGVKLANPTALAANSTFTGATHGSILADDDTYKIEFARQIPMAITEDQIFQGFISALNVLNIDFVRSLQYVAGTGADEALLREYVAQRGNIKDNNKQDHSSADPGDNAALGTDKQANFFKIDGTDMTADSPAPSGAGNASMNSRVYAINEVAETIGPNATYTDFLAAVKKCSNSGTPADDNESILEAVRSSKAGDNLIRMLSTRSFDELWATAGADNDRRDALVPLSGKTSSTDDNLRKLHSTYLLSGAKEGFLTWVASNREAASYPSSVNTVSWITNATGAVNSNNRLEEAIWKATTGLAHKVEDAASFIAEVTKGGSLKMGSDAAKINGNITAYLSNASKSKDVISVSAWIEELAAQTYADVNDTYATQSGTIDLVYADLGISTGGHIRVNSVTPNLSVKDSERPNSEKTILFVMNGMSVGRATGNLQLDDYETSEALLAFIGKTIDFVNNEIIVAIGVQEGGDANEVGKLSSAIGSSTGTKSFTNARVMYNNLESAIKANFSLFDFLMTILLGAGTAGVGLAQGLIDNLSSSDIASASNNFTTLRAIATGTAGKTEFASALAQAGNRWPATPFSGSLIGTTSTAPGIAKAQANILNILVREFDITSLSNLDYVRRAFALFPKSAVQALMEITDFAKTSTIMSNYFDYDIASKTKCGSMNWLTSLYANELAGAPVSGQTSYNTRAGQMLDSIYQLAADETKGGTKMTLQLHNTDGDIAAKELAAPVANLRAVVAQEYNDLWLAKYVKDQTTGALIVTTGPVALMTQSTHAGQVGFTTEQLKAAVAFLGLDVLEVVVEFNYNQHDNDSLYMSGAARVMSRILKKTADGNKFIYQGTYGNTETIAVSEL